MKMMRVFGDASGETHLVEVETPDGQIPATGVNTGASQQRPFHDFHPASRRGLVVALRGEFEIATTTGARKRFRQGEWLLADDVGSKGHTFEGFGDEQVMLQILVPDDWTVSSSS
jgi:hypothetical protein